MKPLLGVGVLLCLFTVACGDDGGSPSPSPPPTSATPTAPATDAPSPTAATTAAPTASPAGPTPPLVGEGWDANAIGYRNQNGERFAFDCPPPAPQRVFVYGTDVYTDDSSICWAGVHSGVITSEDGGRVVIEIRPGQESYEGSERNSVTSQSYGAYTGSFAVIP